MKNNIAAWGFIVSKFPNFHPMIQRGTFRLLSEVNNREKIVATEANNDTYCLPKRIKKFPLWTHVIVHVTDTTCGQVQNSLTLGWCSCSGLGVQVPSNHHFYPHVKQKTK